MLAPRLLRSAVRPGLAGLAIRPGCAGFSTQSSDAKDLGARFTLSMEVAVSKLFPGGFGWQLASGYADGMGFAAESAGFAVITGAGDAIGVGGGHIIYYGIKKAIVDPDINMFEQVSLGTWLGSAAMISGTIWQPTVNLCGAMGLAFPGTFGVTGAVCGLGFFAGLRLFRSLYSNFMAVPAGNKTNLVADAQLSVSIGGATGTFTGTDPALAGNFYAPLIGVQDADSALLGCTKAGGSTFLGFLKVQSLQNVLYPGNRNWIDGGKMKSLEDSEAVVNEAKPAAAAAA